MSEIHQRTFRHCVGFATTLLAITAPVAQAADELPLFTADDVFELEYANDPQVSPDGRWIVYERRANDIMTDRTRSNLWLLATDGERHRPIVSGPIQATSPRWSPSGDRLAWLEAGDHGTDIKLRYMDDGSVALVATIRRGASALVWSPDGEMLAFESSVKGESEPLVAPRSGPEGSDWSEPVKVLDAVRALDGDADARNGHTRLTLLFYRLSPGSFPLAGLPPIRGRLAAPCGPCGFWARGGLGCALWVNALETFDNSSRRSNGFGT